MLVGSAFDEVGLRFSPDGRLLAIASGDWQDSDAGTVVLWDLRGGTTKQQFNTVSPVGAIAFLENAGV